MKKDLMNLKRKTESTEILEEIKEEPKNIENATVYEKLKEIVPKFFKNKKSMDDLKKTVDKANAKIKQIMSEEQLEKIDIDNYSVVCSKTVKSNFIDDMLIDKLKNLKAGYLIKTKEYVDTELLETAIYNGKINPEDIMDCQTTTETLRLTVKEKK